MSDKWRRVMDSMYEEGSLWDADKKRGEESDDVPRQKAGADVVLSLAAMHSTEARRRLGATFVHDPSAWREAFSEGQTSSERRALRRVVHDGTVEAQTRGHYWASRGEPVRRVELPTRESRHVMMDLTDEPEPGVHLRESRYAGTAHFIYADVVDVAVFMKQDRKADPLVLVFGGRLAEPSVGEGFRQLDYVVRRTTLTQHVPSQATLPARGGLYVPSAQVVRSNEATGYKFLLHPIRLSMLVANAPRNEVGGYRVNDSASFVEEWRRRIDCVLTVALQKGHDSLVLGAWGCGDQGNNCGQSAALWKEAITQRFRGCFRHVVFSFLHDREAFQVYSSVFGAPSMPTPEDEWEQYERKRRTFKLQRTSQDESSAEIMDWG